MKFYIAHRNEEIEATPDPGDIWRSDINMRNAGL